MLFRCLTNSQLHVTALCLRLAEVQSVVMCDEVCVAIWGWLLCLPLSLSLWHIRMFLAKVTCASDFCKKTCAHVYATSESFLSKESFESDFRKKTFRCVIGFRSSDCTLSQTGSYAASPAMFWWTDVASRTWGWGRCDVWWSLCGDLCVITTAVVCSRHSFCVCMVHFAAFCWWSSACLDVPSCTLQPSVWCSCQWIFGLRQLKPCSHHAPAQAT